MRNHQVRDVVCPLWDVGYVSVSYFVSGPLSINERYKIHRVAICLTELLSIQGKVKR